MNFTEEMRKKAIETRMNGIKQQALPEETETHIGVSYIDKYIYIYTNKATVMNRMERAGIEHYKEGYMNGEIWDRDYKIPFKDMVKVIKVGLFK